MENHSKNIRNSYNNNIRIFQSIVPCVNYDVTILTFMEIISKIFAINYKDEKKAIEESKRITEENRILLSQNTMYVVQIFTDLYKWLNLREKMGIIDELDEHILNDLRNVREYKDVLAIISSQKNFQAIIDSLGFNGLIVYDKVLQIKALDARDIRILESINPFFLEEYENYNVVVDENFMARQIKKCQDIFKDGNKSYADAAKFLEQYSIINDSLINRLKEKYNVPQNNSIEKILKNFYQDR